MSTDSNSKISCKNKMKSLLYNSTVRIVIVELLVIFLSWCVGFRITYAPELENNWDAISAVGEWVGAIIIPFVVLWLQHRWESNKSDIALSNLVTLEQLNEFERKFAPLLNETSDDKKGDTSATKSNLSLHEKQLLQFLAISMGANIREIALRMGLSTPTVQRLLHKMIQEGKIIAYGTSRGRVYKAVYTPGNINMEEQ